MYTAMFSCLKLHVGILVTPAEVEVFWKLTMSIPAVQKVFFLLCQAAHLSSGCLLSLYLLCLSFSGTLHIPDSLLTSRHSLPISALTGLFNLNSTLLTPPPHPTTPTPHPPAMGKFIQVFSLTKRLSVSDTNCLGNYCSRDIVTSENITNKHTITQQLHTHKIKKNLREISKNILCVLVYKYSIAAHCRPACYVPAVTLHFNFAACICTTCCSDQCERPSLCPSQPLLNILLEISIKNESCLKTKI